MFPLSTLNKQVIFATYLWIVLICLLCPYPQIHAQVFDYYDMEQNGIDGVDGLAGSYGVVVSPDDKFVYTASSTDDAVAVFSRDTSTGDLTFVEVHIDDGLGGSIDGLNNSRRLTISPNGAYLYVPAATDDAIVVFTRNSTTGKLTYVETQKDGVSGVDGLDGAHEVVVSPDNKHLYLVGSIDDAIAVFSIASGTGALTFVEFHQDGVSGIDGLNGARGVYIAADGKHVYVASSVDDAIAVFSRNSTTGVLTFVETQKDGVSGVDGLNGAYGIFVSHDNNYVYAVGSTDDAVTTFSRNTTSGALTFVATLKDESQTGGTIPNLNGARSVKGTSDSAYIIVVSSLDHSLTIFDRNTTTGMLTYNEDHVDNFAGVDGLNTSNYLALSNDCKNIYTVSSGDDALTVFQSAALLPIELVQFDVILKNESTHLSWTTATEVNNDYFTIERSADAYNWEALEDIPAAGDSYVKTTYEAMDDQPILGQSYYRLKQTDINGLFTYSPTRAITHQPSKGQIILYPNPAALQLTIEGAGLESQTFKIFDIQGQEVSRYTRILEKSKGRLSLDISQLLNGMYTVHLGINSFQVYKNQ